MLGFGGSDGRGGVTFVAEKDRGMDWWDEIRRPRDGFRTVWHWGAGG